MLKIKELGVAVLVVAASALLLFGGGYIAGRKSVRIVEPEPRTDTLWVRDTFTAYIPVEIERRIVDSVLVEVKDTIVLKDTLLAVLPREAVTWRDTLSEVYVSGVMPQVDSVRHFVTTKVVTIETERVVEKENHWGVGIIAGYGFMGSQHSPFLGVGISYNILHF